MKKNHFLKMLLLALAVVTASAFVTLGGETQAAGVKLNKTRVSIKEGKSVKLKVLNTKQKVKWATSSKSIATVSQKGVVKGKKAGTAYITARAGRNKLICKVVVKKSPSSGKDNNNNNNNNTTDVYANSVTLDRTKAEIYVSGTVQLNAAVSPSNAKVTSKVWTSSNSNVATVNSTGLVAGISQGTATITVTVSSGGKVYNASCTVTVKSNGGGSSGGDNPSSSDGFTKIADYLMANGKASSYYYLSDTNIDDSGYKYYTSLIYEPGTSASADEIRMSVLSGKKDGTSYNYDFYYSIEIKRGSSTKASVVLMYTDADDTNYFYRSEFDISSYYMGMDLNHSGDKFPDGITLEDFNELGNAFAQYILTVCDKMLGGTGCSLADLGFNF